MLPSNKTNTISAFTIVFSNYVHCFYTNWSIMKVAIDLTYQVCHCLMKLNLTIWLFIKKILTIIYFLFCHCAMTLISPFIDVNCSLMMTLPLIWLMACRSPVKLKSLCVTTIWSQYNSIAIKITYCFPIHWLVKLKSLFVTTIWSHYRRYCH